MLTEKFTTCDDLADRLTKSTKDMLRVNKYISFMLTHASYFDTDMFSLLRGYHSEQSDELREQMVQTTVAAYRRFLEHNNPGQDLTTLDNQQITNGLDQLYLNQMDDESVYPVYLYPYPRAKFQATFFGDIFPANARTYLSVLSDHGYLWFKKSYTVYIQKELTDNLVPLLFNDPVDAVASLDIGQIISDLQANVAFYKQHYIELQQENVEMRRTIDQMSTEINSQALTRWY